LVVEGLTVHCGGVRAVRDVGFTVAAGRAVGVIGANGAG
jgi:branched-chain amino acid transport system ATP-binding protein